MNKIQTKYLYILTPVNAKLILISKHKERFFLNFVTGQKHINVHRALTILNVKPEEMNSLQYPRKSWFIF